MPTLKGISKQEVMSESCRSVQGSHPDLSELTPEWTR